GYKNKSQYNESIAKEIVEGIEEEEEEWKDILKKL
ncbi:unnamed protein product, partial [marine sediment metagenome]